jgi:solute carrier family 25 protein 38
MWRILPGSAVYFFLLDKVTTGFRQTLSTDVKSLPVHLSLLSAAVARGAASFLFLPITVVKTRFEAMGPNRPYSSTLGALKSIAATEGIRSLWSGLVPTILRDVPHSALYFAMYNYTKSIIIPMRPPDSKVPVGVLNFSAGIISGLSATIISHPFDVIRTRLQTQYSTSSPVKGTFEMTRQIIKV